MTFRRYDHLERLGHQEVAQIEGGEVHVFPKLDGTNASAWLGTDEQGLQRVCCGSRNQELAGGLDNQGFRAWVESAAGAAVRDAVRDNPDWILYGEWLVPHTVKGYEDFAWRRFWIFDVYSRSREAYVSAEEYVPRLSNRGLDVMLPMAVLDKPSPAELRALADKATFLMKDRAPGEGIVIKNYGWRNRHGRQTWAKVISPRFAEDKGKPAAEPMPGDVEAMIVASCLTPDLVAKARAKAVASVGGAFQQGVDPVLWAQSVEAEHRGKVIPATLSTSFHDVVTEELWGQLAKLDYPQVDFRVLRKLCYDGVKRLAPDLFA